MNVHDLTPRQLKRAAAIKEQMEKLNQELRRLLGPPSITLDGPVKKRRRMSAAARKRIAAAQKARWAKARKAKSAT